MSIPQGHPDNRPACAACKHQRRKCAEDCVFAEYFPVEKTDDFKAALEVFGVKNMARILNSLGSNKEREKAVASIVWEAKVWKLDPVNGPLGAFRSDPEQLALQSRAFRPFVMDSAGLIGVNNSANESNQGNYVPGTRIVRYEQQGPNCHNVNRLDTFSAFNSSVKYPGQRSVIANQGPPALVNYNVNNYHMGFGGLQDGPIHEPMFAHRRPNNDGLISGILDAEFQGGSIGNYAGFVERPRRQGQGREDGVRNSNSNSNRTIVPFNQANINEGYRHQ